ncbi:MAG: ribonuclease H [Gemmatimonadales bacterium]
MEILGHRRTGAPAHRAAAGGLGTQRELWETAVGEARAPESDASGGGIARCDYFLSEPDTTNNRMALRSTIVALDLVAARGAADIRFVTDSNYIVQGMTAWVGAWRARGWRRKGGAIENLDLWQALVERAAGRRIAWEWVRGHAGHAKNEYANHLATRAAAEQTASDGLEPSRFAAWLESERAHGRYARYDPDADLRRHG